MQSVAPVDVSAGGSNYNLNAIESVVRDDPSGLTEVLNLVHHLVSNTQRNAIALSHTLSVACTFFTMSTANDKQVYEVLFFCLSLTHYISKHLALSLIAPCIRSIPPFNRYVCTWLVRVKYFQHLLAHQSCYTPPIPPPCLPAPATSPNASSNANKILNLIKLGSK